MVTGGTGFIGAYTVRALLDAGHEVRLLVRDPVLLETVLQPLGVDDVDHVVGDARDAEAVTRAFVGCDAAVHAAAVVTIDQRRAEEVTATNLAATECVLGGARSAGLDPIVYVSSVSALAPSEGAIRPDSPVATPRGAYARSKAAAEGYARGLQAEGVPVAITYPAMVLGPPAGIRRSADAGDFFVTALKHGVAVAMRGAWSVVDVRDVAAVHAALVRPGAGPRRYSVGGHFLEYRDALSLIERVTGRRLRRIEVPVAPLRVLAWVAEAIGRFVPLSTYLTPEALSSVVDAVPVDDSRTTTDLCVRFREPEVTLAATIRGLHEAGELSAGQVGTLASTEPGRSQR
jgi:nucleoside-diphosphate-sugar epimerase